MAMRRNPFVRVGRPPSTGAGVGMRPRGMKPSMGKPQMGPGAGAGLSAMPGAGASPMQGLQQAVPGGSFRRGGSVGGFARMAHHHDDKALRRGASEDGFSSSDDHFCSGGKVR